MIGSCNCPITANCLITLSDYNFADQLEQNTAVYSPITFEEIVIVLTILSYLDHRRALLKLNANYFGLDIDVLN